MYPESRKYYIKYGVLITASSTPCWAKGPPPGASLLPLSYVTKQGEHSPHQGCQGGGIHCLDNVQQDLDGQQDDPLVGLAQAVHDVRQQAAEVFLLCGHRERICTSPCASSVPSAGWSFPSTAGLSGSAGLTRTGSGRAAMSDLPGPKWDSVREVQGDGLSLPVRKGSSDTEKTAQVMGGVPNMEGIQIEAQRSLGKNLSRI